MLGKYKNYRKGFFNYCCAYCGKGITKPGNIMQHIKFNHKELLLNKLSQGRDRHKP